MVELSSNYRISSPNKPISAISRDPENQGLSPRLKLPPQKSKIIGYKPRAKLFIVTQWPLEPANLTENIRN